ncbi:MAG: dTDP-4-dehydrorhamnose 3,5-epimerase [Candidatus Binataceae bacterium]|nr:dTDP-4-dehydrorhamnose 3,5-epimerase [Candidatus Binataceae bacterium]
MKFTETALKGAFVLDPEMIEDDRGFFARTFCRKEFAAYNLNPDLVQCSISFNRQPGTLRGMHYQSAPHAEAKLIRCTRGAIYDVILDLRSHSPTFRRWVAVHLSAENRQMVYVPEGFAHGFQTLEDETEVSYYISEFYSPEHARGVRWNDPAFAIGWPIANPVISVRDQTHPEFAS